MNPRIHRNGLHAFFSRQHALLMEARSRPIGDSVRARRTGRPHRHLAGGLNAKPSRDRKRAVSDEVRNPKERGGSTMPAARLISAVSASRPRKPSPRRLVPNPNPPAYRQFRQAPGAGSLGPPPLPHPINFIAHRSLTVAARFAVPKPTRESSPLGKKRRSERPWARLEDTTTSPGSRERNFKCFWAKCRQSLARRVRR